MINQNNKTSSLRIMTNASSSSTANSTSSTSTSNHNHHLIHPPTPTHSSHHNLFNNHHHFNHHHHQPFIPPIKYNNYTPFPYDYRGHPLITHGTPDPMVIAYPSSDGFFISVTDTLPVNNGHAVKGGGCCGDAVVKRAIRPSYFRHYPTATRSTTGSDGVTEIGSGSRCQDVCFRSFRLLILIWTLIGLLTLLVSLALGLYHWNSWKHNNYHETFGYGFVDHSLTSPNSFNLNINPSINSIPVGNNPNIVGGGGGQATTNTDVNINNPSNNNNNININNNNNNPSLNTPNNVNNNVNENHPPPIPPPNNKRNLFYVILLDFGPVVSFFVSLTLLLIPALGFFGSYKENTWLLLFFVFLMIINAIIKSLYSPRNPFLGFSVTLFLLLIPFVITLCSNQKMSRAI